VVRFKVAANFSNVYIYFVHICEHRHVVHLLTLTAANKRGVAEIHSIKYLHI